VKNRYFRPLLFAALWLTLSAPARAANETEAAPTSRLAGITLPARAQRVLDSEAFAKAVKNLKAAFEQCGAVVRGDETLLWTDQGYQRDKAGDILQGIAAQLRKAGYQYGQNEEVTAQGGTPKTTDAPAAPHVEPVAPKLPALKAKPGYVIGRAVDARGKPLSNVTIFIGGTTFAGGRAAEYSVEVKNGEYELEVPDGLYYVHAILSVLYNGQKYKIELHPIDDTRHWLTSNSKNGIVKDFFWKLWGMNTYDAADNSPGRHHGGRILLKEESVFPKGSTIQITLAPQGPLIDGSQGQTLSLRATAPVPRRGLGALLDIPIGRYTVTTELILPDGRTQPVRVIVQPVFGTARAAPAATATLDFAPDDSSNGTKEVLLFVLY